MSIQNYGVWVAQPVRVSAERAQEDPDTPHIHLFYNDGTGGDFNDARRASIMVYVLNRTASGLSLKGWSLLNKSDQPHIISGDVWLPPGGVQAIAMEQTPLSNQGGLITLLDAKGNKVDGVGYTREMSSKEGELVVFR
jgi:hypothetical protein